MENKIASCIGRWGRKKSKNEQELQNYRGRMGLAEGKQLTAIWSENYLVHRSTEIRVTEIIPDAWMEQNIKINHKNKKPKIEESVTH